MKLKITITGPKVQGVGYRSFLAEMAIRVSLHGFEVYNEDDNTVVALIEGDERKTKRFLDSINKGSWVQVVEKCHWNQMESA